MRQNSPHTMFYHYTFLANVYGSALFALSYILDSEVHIPTYATAFQVGFCGSFTTLSSLIAEARVLGTWFGAVYVLASIGTTQALMILTLGLYEWLT